jgi:hypothetical protein
MARMLHGQTVSLDQVQKALDKIRETNNFLGLASAPAKIVGLTPFDYMFPRLQDEPDALLPPTKEVVQNLIDLGKTMNAPTGQKDSASTIPAAYTYFGQFVAHDITLELQSERISRLNDPEYDLLELRPLPRRVITDEIKNTRTPTIDLDSVYGATSEGTPVPQDCAKLIVGSVIRAADAPAAGPAPKNKPDENNDLPRKPPSDKPEIDREALIGDARNEENLITSQMHVAFLRAHNSLVARGLTFREARKMLMQHFQWLIIKDYLPRVANHDIVNDILYYGNRFYRPPVCTEKPLVFCPYMPLEFSVAAFRFGHSMVRRSYDYNSNFEGEKAAPLGDLFMLKALNNEPSNFNRLPEKWVIDWSKFTDNGSNATRMIGPSLVDPLFELKFLTGGQIDGVRGSLAVRNLLRGFLLRMPTGQKVAGALGLPVMSADDIKRAAASVSQEQVDVLSKSGFLENTPLWYYILAEAGAILDGSGGLGLVGSTIVAEVLIGLVRWSDDSILSEPGWKPVLGEKPDEFFLQDLFRLAGVWT